MIVTFEQAKKLQKLGFNEETDKAYQDKNIVVKEDPFIPTYQYISAPSVSDALQWIRENKDIPILYVCSAYENEHYGVFEYRKTDCYPTYPEAESALLDAVITYLKELK